MPQYPDRRNRYEGAAPWEAGLVKEHSLASRGSSPGGHFRFATAEIPPESESPVVLGTPIPQPLTEKDIEL